MPTARSEVSFARPVARLPGEADRRRAASARSSTRSPTRRLLVVGDLIADEFIYGEVARVSREAPVLILKYDATEVVPGGAGNAASNVAALGGRAVARGHGRRRSREGRRLLGQLPRGVDRSTGRRASATYPTPVKTRILAGGIHSAKQQVVRIDRETGMAGVARRSAARFDRAG